MTWRLDKGLWVYIDGAFRGLTKTPKTLPVVFKKEPELLVIGRKNVGPDFRGAKFGIGSFAIFSRFLTRKETEHVFAVKSTCYVIKCLLCFESYDLAPDLNRLHLFCLIIVFIKTYSLITRRSTLDDV